LPSFKHSVIKCGNWCGICYVVFLYNSVSTFLSTLPFCSFNFWLSPQS